MHVALTGGAAWKEANRCAGPGPPLAPEPSPSAQGMTDLGQVMGLLFLVCKMGTLAPSWEVQGIRGGDG